MALLLRGSPYTVSESVTTVGDKALGVRFETPWDTKKKWIYVQNVGPATVAGDCVYWTDTSGYKVSTSTSVIDGTLGSCNKPCGIAVSAIPQDSFGYVCCNASVIRVKGDGTAIRGDYIMGPNSAAAASTKADNTGRGCVFGRILEQTDPTDNYNDCSVWIEPVR